MVRTMSATGLSLEANCHQNRNEDRNVQCNLVDRHRDNAIDSTLQMRIEPLQDIHQNDQNECESNLNHDEPSVFEEITTESPSTSSSLKYHVTDLRPKRASPDNNDIGNDHLFQFNLSDDDSNDNTKSTDSIPRDIAEIQFAQIQYDEAPDTNTVYPIPEDSTISYTTTITTDCQRVTLRCDSSTPFDNFMRFGTWLIFNVPTECALYSPMCSFFNFQFVFQIKCKERVSIRDHYWLMSLSHSVCRRLFRVEFQGIDVLLWAVCFSVDSDADSSSCYHSADVLWWK